MRPAVLFFICTCFLFISGHGYAASHHRRTCSLSARDTEGTQTKLASKADHLPGISKTEAVINIEDEDEAPVFNRKHVVYVSFIMLAINSFLAELYNIFKNRLPFCAHLSDTSSYKYILQRVLRI